WEDRYFDLKNGQSYTTDHKFKSGEVSITEYTPEGWTLTDVDCYEKNQWGTWDKMWREGEFYAQQDGECKCALTNDKNGEIEGHKFNDLNGNGVGEEGEPTMEGWTIERYKKVCSPVENEQPKVSQVLRIDNPKHGGWKNFNCEYELQETD